MDSCRDGNAARSDAHKLNVSWSEDNFDYRISQPQLLDPHFEVMYTTPGPITFADTPSHMSSPSTMTTLSEPGGFPSPASSAPSPYFTEPSTPANPPVKKSHSRRRPPGHIPRPRNAFILFRSHYVAAQLIPGKVENDHRHISKIIGEIWNTLPPAERLLWEQRADVEKETHSRMYPNYRYKPLKLEGVVKRRVKCRGTGALTSPYSSIPGIGNGAPRELVGSLSLAEGGGLQFVDGEKARLIEQEERRKDRARCARVAELVKRGVVGEQLEQEAQRLGLDRESTMAGNPRLEPSQDGPPGRQGHFHTNVDVLRALGELNDNTPVFTNPFAPQNSQIASAPGPRSPNVAPNRSSPPNAASPVHDCMPGGILTANNGQSNSHSREPNIEKDSRGWPHRRASSLPPLPPPPIYREFDAHPHLLVIEPSQPKPDSPTISLPRRPSSSSPVRRHRHLPGACPPPRNEEAAEKVQEHCQDREAFDHLNYCSPTTSPPEYFYSPNTYPHLQLNYPPSGQASPHATLLSPLYDIDMGHGAQRQRDSIGLSMLYPPDTLNGDNSTLHSTYATSAGKAHSPIPATPATACSDHSLAMHKQVDHQGPDSALGFVPSPGPAEGFSWHTTYGPAPGYGQLPHYNPNIIRYGQESQQLFTPGTGEPSY